MQSSLVIKESPGSEAWGIKIRQRARKLAKAIDQGYIELAEVIHTIWSTPINGEKHNACVCVAWGYDNYKQWAKDELGLGPRKVERLKAVWHHLYVTLEGKLDHRTQKRILSLGFSKVRELIRVIDSDNADQWIEVGENLNQKELALAVQQALLEEEQREQAAAVGTDDDDDDEEWKGTAPPDDIGRFRELKFNLTPEQKANIELALGRAQELANSKKKGHCLDLICTDFLSTNDFFRPDDPEMPLRFLAKFERLMGKRLVVIDAKTWLIEYGIDALEKAAEVLESTDD